MITVNNVWLSAGNTAILKNINVVLPAQRITILLGASGAGKTSLLKCIAQIYTQYTGTILLHDKDIKQYSAQQRAHAIGVVFQQCHLFPHMSVLQNCVQPQIINGSSKSEAEKQAQEMLKKLGITCLASLYPYQLSGGQQQRVAIARTLCLQPHVLFLDEPSSSLDPQNTKVLAALLKKFNAAGMAIVLCSHDVVLIKAMLLSKSLPVDIYFLTNGTIVDHVDVMSEQDLTKSSLKEFLTH
jgi:ABC-type polar amino acid transport system ATPase subunit